MDIAPILTSTLHGGLGNLAACLAAQSRDRRRGGNRTHPGG